MTEHSVPHNIRESMPSIGDLFTAGSHDKTRTPTAFHEAGIQAHAAARGAAVSERICR